MAWGISLRELGSNSSSLLGCKSVRAEHNMNPSFWVRIMSLIVSPQDQVWHFKATHHLKAESQRDQVKTGSRLSDPHTHTSRIRTQKAAELWERIHEEILSGQLSCAPHTPEACRNRGVFDANTT